MQKQFILSIAVAALLLTGCKPGGYTVTGTVENPEMNGKYIYLGSSNDHEKRDSVLVENSSFMFKGQQETPDIYLLHFSYELQFPTVPLVLENSDIKVHIGEISTAEGTADNDRLATRQRKLHELNQTGNRINEALANAETDDEKERIKEEKKRYHENYETYQIDFIADNAGNLAGAYVLSSTYFFLSIEQLDKIFANASGPFLEQPGVIEAQEMYEKLKKVNIGSPFTDFSMPDQAGETVHLSDYAGKGKVVLIDFWASWCGPCIAEIPNLKATYDQFHSEGFEIVGVSLDNNKENWLAAIEKHQLAWPHMSDLKGWQSEGGQIYGISYIPQTVLIDGKGTIISKNISGDELRKKLEELLK